MIRPVKLHEAIILTRISFASKKHWVYPQEYFTAWKNELTISPDYIEKNTLFVYAFGNWEFCQILIPGDSMKKWDAGMSGIFHRP